MTTMQDLGISREDILDKAAEKLLEGCDTEGYLIDEVRRQCVSEIVKSATPKIDGILNEALAGLVDAKFTPVDEWGEPMRKTSTTLREMVKEKALKFLAEKVDKDGKSTYQAVGSRGEWMAKKAATEAITYEVKKELTKAVESAKSDLTKLVADHITQTLLKR